MDQDKTIDRSPSNMKKPVIAVFEQLKNTDAYRFFFVINKILSIIYLFISLSLILSFVYMYKNEGISDIELKIDKIRSLGMIISLFVLGFGFSHLKNWAFFISSSICCALILSAILTPSTNFLFLLVFKSIWLIHSILYFYLLINQRSRNIVIAFIFCSFCFYYPVKLFFGI